LERGKGCKALPIATHKGFLPPFAPSLPSSVTGEGKVIAVVPAVKQLVVEHGEIKGFMEAMTMGCKIHPPSLLNKLKAGDNVTCLLSI
jgi:Cu/Ag efflux protein CusF